MANDKTIERPIAALKRLPQGKYLIHRDGFFTGSEAGEQWVPFATSNLAGEDMIEVDRMISELNFPGSQYLGFLYAVSAVEEGKLGGLMKFKPTISFEAIPKPALAE